MKKLSIALALTALMIAGTAYAAEPAATDAPTPPPAGKKHDGKDRGPKGKKRPGFKECDTNNDGVLSLEEFLACYPRGGKERFEAIDADKDGKVTRDEMKAHRDSKKAERRQAFFKACDKNGDGMLSLEEFEQCAMNNEFQGPKGKKDRPRPEAS